MGGDLFRKLRTTDRAPILHAVSILQQKRDGFIAAANLDYLPRYRTSLVNHYFFDWLCLGSPWEWVNHSTFRALQLTLLAILGEKFVDTVKGPNRLFVSLVQMPSSQGDSLGNRWCCFGVSPYLYGSAPYGQFVEVDVLALAQQLRKLSQIQGQPIKRELARVRAFDSERVGVGLFHRLIMAFAWRPNLWAFSYSRPKEIVNA
ncbi:Uncharacterised protein [Pseudomonas aeruginosa]|nr:hypothetical protein AN455_19395 [Pseudomonas aeruginosa]SQC96531.1 Uncharacterised protein [Pseudomonas aeruginosa]